MRREGHPNAWPLLLETPEPSFRNIHLFQWSPSIQLHHVLESGPRSLKHRNKADWDPASLLPQTYVSRIDMPEGFARQFHCKGPRPPPRGGCGRARSSPSTVPIHFPWYRYQARLPCRQMCRSPRPEFRFALKCRAGRSSRVLSYPEANELA